MSLPVFQIAMLMVDGRRLTDEIMSDILDKIKKIKPDISDDEITSVKNELEYTFGITIEEGELLSVEHKIWLPDVKPDVNWEYWDSYRKLLANKGWSPEVIRVLDEDTDAILGECGNPYEENLWKIRGLVMGDVQSGKTASYTGLINKAADTGYKVIILLTGVIEELRKQTQERLDEGFVGRDSRNFLSASKTSKIGVGLIRREKYATVLTSVDKDFLSSNASAIGGISLDSLVASEPLLLVLKKNKSPLQALTRWLEDQRKNKSVLLSYPLLIIDDEADNASVNTKKDDTNPTIINRSIRDILKIFARSNYVAYTATPFANIFINPDNDEDLFPADFIYSLDTPSNYIGADKIFLDDGFYNENIRDAGDAEEIFPYKHKKDLEVNIIPESLEQAVVAFMLSCVVRDLRKERLKHRSMLINVSRFTDVQAKIAQKIKEYIYEIKEEVKQFSSMSTWEKYPNISLIYNVWKNEYAEVEFTWDDIKRSLYKSISSISVVTINQKSEEKLHYNLHDNETGRRVIAVGGLSLSRGLTLEGLAISYFYRNSIAYDTLLQMGRWFGYRNGYDDLCRIWMDADAIGWYSHIANSVYELRMEFRRMSAAKMRPMDFGLKVREHPDTLIVTAMNKMRNSKSVKHRISFNLAGIETSCLHVSKEIQNENIRVASDLLSCLPEKKPDEYQYIWSGIDKKLVADFIADLNIHEWNTEFQTNEGDKTPVLSKFILENRIDKLQKWDVYIPQGKGIEKIAMLGDYSNKISPRQRQFERYNKKANCLIVNKRRVGEARDEKVGLSDLSIKCAEQWFSDKKNKEVKNVSGYAYRHFRKNPLLVLSFVEYKSSDSDSKKAKVSLPSETFPRVMVAISLFFPDFDEDGNKNDRSQETVLYRLNTVAIRERFGISEDDDEDSD